VANLLPTFVLGHYEADINSRRYELVVGQEWAIGVDRGWQQEGEEQGSSSEAGGSAEP